MKRALLIASNVFAPDSGIESLRFPLNDVEAMERILRADDFTFEVDKLVNPTSSEALRALDRWISKADYDDLVLVYYSGHGKLSRARELFLSCADTNNSSLISTALKYTQLTDLIRERSLQKIAVILDCCYAGRAIDGARGDSRGAIEEQVRIAVEPPGSGIFFLGASGKNQTAEERESDGHGRLTKAIIDGLSSGDADIDNDGNISAKDLATYVKKRLRVQNADQEPIEGGAYQGELILGSNRRKLLEAALLAIRQRIEESKVDFTKETFRRIDDYLDDIRGGRLDPLKGLIDARWSVLNMYTAKEANLEQVAKTFWTPPIIPPAVPPNNPASQFRGWLDVKSWSYWKMGALAFALGIATQFATVLFLGASELYYYGSSHRGISIISEFVLVGMICALVALLTAHRGIGRLVLLFAIIYAFLWSLNELGNTVGYFNIWNFVLTTLSLPALWFIVASFVSSLKEAAKDKLLVVAMPIGAALWFANYLVSDQVFNTILYAGVLFSTVAVGLAYGIRRHADWLTR